MYGHFLDLISLDLRYLHFFVSADITVGHRCPTLHIKGAAVKGSQSRVYSNSRNDVPRVAQRYGTIAAHTRRRASVLVVFVVFFACTCTVLPV